MIKDLIIAYGFGNPFDLTLVGFAEVKEQLPAFNKHRYDIGLAPIDIEWFVAGKKALLVQGTNL